MSLATGTRIGPYEVISLIGAGGMGEVYRARDTQLDRHVAIKVLPETFVTDREHVARFEREAKVLASLNHPHIAAVYGLDEAEGVRALVMELVEGEDLAQRLTRGPIPLDEALPIAKQIAEALKAAHEHGIVHRDLKPANIKLRPDGTAKVLDFGLAKALVPAAASGDLVNSPTLTFAATQVGVILGTAAYMAPEQVRAKAVDKRADIWAFGAVLYEMLTGQRAFQGEDISLTLAEVMKSEPEWTLLPPDVPAGIRGVLKQCLQKDPRQRLHDIADVGLLMAAAADSPDTAAVAPHRRWPIAIAIGVAAATLVVAFAAIVLNRRSAVPLPVMKATFALPDGQVFSNAGRRVVAMSPDGSQFAYVANGRLYVRPLAALDATPVAGMDEAAGVVNPVFAPDGRSIAFWSPNTIKRVSVGGGPPVPICEAFRPLGMSWQGDTILFGQGADGIKQVSAGGGKPETLVTVRPGEIAHGPQMLPGGRAVLFTIASESGDDRWDKAHIVVQPLAGGARKTIIEGGSDARFLPTGHLLYAYQGVLFAVPFDLGLLETKGDAVPVVEGVLRVTDPDFNTGAAQFDVSTAGLLIYAAGPGAIAGRSLAFIDRRGGIERLNLPPGLYETPRVSPDGKRIAYSTTVGSDRSIYIYDLSSSALPRRLTYEGSNRFPVWSADGLRVAFQSNRDGDLAIFWQRADGTDAGERLTRPEPGASHFPDAWSGDALIYTERKSSGSFVWRFLVRERKAEPLSGVMAKAGMAMPQPSFSPDGRWLAYRSEEPGSTIYVQPFPATGAKHQITSGSGPVWSRDGTKLFFAVSRQRQLGVVNISTLPVVTAENRETFNAPLAITMLTVTPFDVAPDDRILVPVAVDASQLKPSTSPRIHIVANWFEELKARVPSK